MRMWSLSWYVMMRRGTRRPMGASQQGKDPGSGGVSGGGGWRTWSKMRRD